MACVTPIPADPKALQTPKSPEKWQISDMGLTCPTHPLQHPWQPIDQLAVRKKKKELFTMKNPMGFESLVLDDWAGLVYHLSS